MMQLVAVTNHLVSRADTAACTVAKLDGPTACIHHRDVLWSCKDVAKPEVYSAGTRRRQNGTFGQMYAPGSLPP